ncbi:MAG: endonuclease III [Kofleriaceae bacterium]
MTAEPSQLTADTAPRDRRGRASEILAILDRYHPAVASFLEHANPYQLLVAVILSAQCTDARVNLVTPALFARAPDAETMAAMKPREVVRYIRTCGLAPGKARNIVNMSKALVSKHAGLVPNDLAALEELPGVGHKTASVVLAQAYNAAVFPVDTHIHRLAGRWQLSRARNVEEVERDLKNAFPEDRWNRLHLQLIEFGRAYCTAKAHAPAQCPICSWAMSKARAKAEVRHGRSKPNQRPKLRKPKPKPGKPKAGGKTPQRKTSRVRGSK